MRQLFFLLLLVLIGAGAYFYFVDASLLEKHAPALAAMIPRAQKEAIAAGVAAASTVEAPSSTAPAPAPATTQVVSVAPGQTAVVTNGESASPRPLDTFKLKNGTVIVGRVIVTDPDMTWIRAEDGTKHEVKTKDIASGLPRSR